MSEKFKIGITRDFLNKDGALSYKDIGLSLVDQKKYEHQFMAVHEDTVTADQLKDLNAVLSLAVKWDKETFAGNTDELLVVARFGVGYDMCDVKAFTENNTLLTIAVGATDAPVASAVLALMLALGHRLFIKDKLVRENRWNERSQYQGTGLEGKTLGIVGFGGAGRHLRELVKPFNMKVLIFDPIVSDEIVKENDVDRVSKIEDLFSQSDYISLHCPLNEHTKGLVNKKLFELMKPTAYFVNAARGPIVNETDLIDALQRKLFAGAGIDVFEQEPPSPNNPLFKMDNVILTPHAVCWTNECFQAIGETAIQSILSVLQGEKPFGILNPEVWDSPAFQQKLSRVRDRVSSKTFSH